MRSSFLVSLWSAGMELSTCVEFLAFAKLHARLLQELVQLLLAYTRVDAPVRQSPT